MNTYRWVGLSIILVLGLALVGCAQPAVTEEPVAHSAVAGTATDVPATEAPEVIEPQIEELEIEEPEIEELAEEESEPFEPPPAEEEALDDEDAQMQALISEKIGGCHMLNFILSQNKTHEEWSVTIDRMIGKGAQVDAEEKEMIIDWLVSREQ